MMLIKRKLPVSLGKKFRVVLLLSCLLPGAGMALMAQNAGHSGQDMTTGNRSFNIGADFGGGRIFWLDGSGRHGLVAAMNDQSARGIAWSAAGDPVTGASADGVFAGTQNTGKITGKLGANAQYAAKLCDDLVITVNNTSYDDWYLPSAYELDLLFRQKKIIGGFNETSGIYWSSTESSTAPGTSAWEQEFKLGGRYEDDKDMHNQVRCIRKF